ncbi:MAG: iron-containing alcohol dehydrogenase [Candidatus Aminicenantes bacterium]|nr:MAG: iron-containing alcohol dehydrogenase [Candidatus Aminicenantes bacterium]
MKGFNYYQPTEIRFGRGRVGEIGEVVSQYGKRCLIVTVPPFSEIEPMFNQVKDSLGNSGVEFAHFDKVIPNPTTEIVSKGAELAKAHDADVVLGLGGGSSMDSAKAIAVEATHEGTAWDYLFFRDTQPTEKTLPVITITTTSGTGSHVTQVAVVTNPEEKCKSAIYNSIVYPKVSIVDPELMLTVPEHITASTGFDVFAHAFESYINPNGSPYTDIMALEAIRLTAKNLPAAVNNGSALDARTQMAWADTLAGLCIANSGVTLPHGIGMAIGGKYPHVMHGEALAVVYPAIMRYSYQHALEKFATVGRLFDNKLNQIDDNEAAERSCDVIQDFIKDIGMLTSFEDLKIPKEELKVLAEASLVLPDYKNHPKVATLDEVFKLLKQSCRL